MKTIGVLGGLDPQATMDFEARLHLVAQGVIPQKFNFGYPPMVVEYLRRPPFLLDEEGKPRIPWMPEPALVEAARRLGAACDFIVVPSNGTHIFQDRIEEASGRRVLSMIELALDEVRARGWKKVGLLGFGEPVVYTRPLTAMGILHETICGEIRDRLDSEIIAVWEGRDSKESTVVANYSVNALRKRGVDGVVLGCTEIPLLLRELSETTDLINPLQLLAEAAVREAMG